MRDTPSSWWARLSIAVPIATFLLMLPAILAIVFGVSSQEKGWRVVVGFTIVIICAAPGYLYTCLEGPRAGKSALVERLWIRSSLGSVAAISLMGAVGASVFLPVRIGCLLTLLLVGHLCYRFERPSCASNNPS